MNYSYRKQRPQPPPYHKQHPQRAAPATRFNQPHMPEITVSQQARQDLIDIWRYVADDNPDAADRLLDTLDTKIALLLDHPLLGPARPDIAPNLRYLIADNYLILYRVRKESVEIVRVLHGARNLSVLFKDDETT